MKVTVLHRQQQTKAVEAIKSDRKAEHLVSKIDIAEQIARARAGFVASRGDFAARASKARSSLPQPSPTVMLG